MAMFKQPDENPLRYELVQEDSLTSNDAVVQG